MKLQYLGFLPAIVLIIAMHWQFIRLVRKWNRSDVEDIAMILLGFFLALGLFEVTISGIIWAFS